MRRLALWVLVAWTGLGYPCAAGACSCAWSGPFLVMAKEAPLVVHGRVVRHHPGPSPSMDVLVLETWRGGLLDSGLVVQMGDGAQCRPALEVFPPGSEWILALNGPGSKPGGGWALSNCGEYWLRVEGGEVVGSIDGTQSEVKKVPFNEVKRRVLYPRFQVTFQGSVKQGERFRRPFGGRFAFLLEPWEKGWWIVIEEDGRDEDLARLTPPFHFLPNPREMEGWHLLEGPSQCQEREIRGGNAPGELREFIFSPEVGRSIAGPDATRSVEARELEEVERFGRGSLSIERFALQPSADGCPGIAWMDFLVRLEGGY